MEWSSCLAMVPMPFLSKHLRMLKKVKNGKVGRCTPPHGPNRMGGLGGLRMSKFDSCGWSGCGVWWLYYVFAVTTWKHPLSAHRSSSPWWSCVNRLSQNPLNQLQNLKKRPHLLIISSRSGNFRKPLTFGSIWIVRSCSSSFVGLMPNTLLDKTWVKWRVLGLTSAHCPGPWLTRGHCFCGQTGWRLPANVIVQFAYCFRFFCSEYLVF